MSLLKTGKDCPYCGGKASGIGHVHATDCNGPFNADRKMEMKSRLKALYETIKSHPILRSSMNWPMFARHAESVGLHYDEETGLMDNVHWELLKGFMKDGYL